MFSNNINKYDYYAEKMNERFKIFQKNYNLISNYNDQGMNFQLDINQYTDQIDFSDDKNSFNSIQDINPNMLKNEDLNVITQKSILSNILHPIKTIKKYLNIPNNINWFNTYHQLRINKIVEVAGLLVQLIALKAIRIKNYTVVNYQNNKS